MHYKKIAFGFLVGVVMVGSATPTAVQALTIPELINLFVALGIIAPDKASLALQAAGGSSTATIFPSITSVSPALCFSLTRVLRTGMNDARSNGEVSKLQLYLQSTGDFTYPSITGFYGIATVQAVQKWQARNGVVSFGSPETTGYGHLGPMTLRSMKEKCGGNNSDNLISASLRASSGPSPLSVIFSGNISGSKSYTLDFGDGSVPFSSIASCDSSSCGSTVVSANHTYAKPGTYKAVLTPTAFCSAASSVGSCQQSLSASLIVEVTDIATTSNALDVFPTSGAAPLTVTFTGQTTATWFGGIRLEYGDGTSAVLCNPGSNGCSSSSSHSYGVAGTYTARLIGVGEGYSSVLASTIITVTNPVVVPDASSNLSSVFPTSGIAPLTVTFESMVNFGHMQGQYVLDFGDGSTQNPPSCYAPTDRCISAGTVSHVYITPGTYTATLKLNGVVKQSVVITVSGVSADSNSFFASPVSGMAPLTVTFTGSRRRVSGCSAVAIEEVNRISFGDGQTSSAVPTCGSFSISHTYSTAGSYSAKLETAGFGQAPLSWTTLGTTMITVTGQTSTQPTLSFSAPLTGTSVKQGNSVLLRWSTAHISSDTKILFTLRTASGSAVKSTSSTDIALGSYTFTIPAATDYCNNYFSDALHPCGTLTPGNYYISATIVSPQSACIGFCPPGSPTVTTVVGANTAQFTIVQ